MKEEEIIGLVSRMRDIANKFAAKTKGQVYNPPYIDVLSKSFKFSVGPITHGMTWPVSLPLSLIDDESSLSEHIEEYEAKWERDRIENICPTCGNNKNFYGYGGYTIV